MYRAAVPHDPKYAPRARGFELGIPRRPRVECPPINPYATVRGPDVPDAPDAPDIIRTSPSRLATQGATLGDDEMRLVRQVMDPRSRVGKSLRPARAVAALDSSADGK